MCVCVCVCYIKRAGSHLWPLEAYESCGEGGGGASDAGLGSGEGDVGILPVLPCRLLDQTIVLHLRVSYRVAQSYRASFDTLTDTRPSLAHWYM